MAGTIFQIQGKDSVVKLNWYPAMNSIQNFEWTPAFNEEYYKELGNEGYAAYSIQPDLTGSFDMTATGSTVAFLRRMILDYTSDGEFIGYDAGDPADSDHNTGTITGADLEMAVFELIESKQANMDFDRSTVLPRCFLSSVAMRADANGTASETYNFEGELSDVFLDPYHDVVSIPLTRASDTVLAIPDVPGTAAAYKCEVSGGPDTGTADWMIAYLMIDEKQITGVDLDADQTLDTITLLNGFEAPIGARLALVIYKKVAGTLPTLGAPPSNARFLRADDISIFLVNKTDLDIYAEADLNGSAVTAVLTEANTLLRAQTADLNIDLRREVLRQIKKSDSGSIYYRAATYPLNITASVTMFESDLSDWARIQDKEFTGSEVATVIDLEKVLNLKDFESPEWQLVIRYYLDDEVVQTSALCDAKVSGRTYRISPDGRAEVTWNLTGSLIKISGSTPSV